MDKVLEHEMDGSDMFNSLGMDLNKIEKKADKHVQQDQVEN